MPAKTAEKKLVIPAICVIVVLSLMALLPLMHSSSTQRLGLESNLIASFPMTEGFYAVSASGVSAYNDEGQLLFEEKIALSPGACASGGEMLAVVSGNTVRVYSREGFLGEISSPDKVICIQMSGDLLSVSRQCVDYACAVTFYDGLEPLFCRYIASSKCTAIALSDSAAMLALDNGQLLFLSGTEEIGHVDIAESAETVYALSGGFCADTGSKLLLFDDNGEKTGEYTDKYTSTQSFGGTLCAVVPGGVAAIGMDGKIDAMAQMPYGNPVVLGMGELPAVILGENVSVFNKKMEVNYIIENKYVPANVITDKSAAILLWQRAAEIHRK